MYALLKPDAAQEFFANGLLRPNVCVPAELVDEIKAHYGALAVRNDISAYAYNASEQATRMTATSANGSLETALTEEEMKAVLDKRIDKKYHKSIYAEQRFIERVFEVLFAQNVTRYFNTRYLLVSHDIYLEHDRERTAFSMHADIPNFDHFYETENDVSILVPLVDFNEENGGRIMILPESKMKVSTDSLLLLFEDFFGADTSALDENGCIDPEKIPGNRLEQFKESSGYTAFLDYFAQSTAMAQRYLNHGHFGTPDVQRGEIVLFNNRNFHAIESWKRDEIDRELYLIRCMPIYDIKMRLPNYLHGKPFNNILVDLEEKTLKRFNHAVDLSTIEANHKLVWL
uniref:PedK-like protein n=1 Tax=uncultured bacterium psy1 TaxID=693111 RepID=D2SUD8_9BACT|nr:PedK-like protein [uncultured bacterium psy1]